MLPSMSGFPSAHPSPRARIPLTISNLQAMTPSPAADKNNRPSSSPMVDGLKDTLHEIRRELGKASSGNAYSIPPRDTHRVDPALQPKNAAVPHARAPEQENRARDRSKGGSPPDAAAGCRAERPSVSPSAAPHGSTLAATPKADSTSLSSIGAAHIVSLNGVPTPQGSEDAHEQVRSSNCTPSLTLSSSPSLLHLIPLLPFYPRYLSLFITPSPLTPPRSPSLPRSLSFSFLPSLPPSLTLPSPPPTPHTPHPPPPPKARSKGSAKRPTSSRRFSACPPDAKPPISADARVLVGEIGSFFSPPPCIYGRDNDPTPSDSSHSPGGSGRGTLNGGSGSPSGSGGMRSGGPQMCGLGVKLRHSTSGQLRIAAVVPGGAAHASGAVAAGDIILAVDGVETVRKSLQEVACMFVGLEATPVGLTLLRNGSLPRTVTLTRLVASALT